MITPVSIDSIGWGTYAYFCVFNFCFIPLIYFFYPETQRLSLEQIDKLFTGDKILLKWSSSMGAPGEAPSKIDSETGVEHSEQIIDRKSDE